MSGAEAGAQHADGVGPGAAVEMVVGDHRGRPAVAAAQQADGELRRRCGEHRIAPALQQRLHALADGGLVLDHHQQRALGSRLADPRRASGTGSSGASEPRGRREREARAAARHRVHAQRMLQHARDTLDDRKPQAEAAVALLGIAAEPAELLEDLGLLVAAGCRCRCRPPRPEPPGPSPPHADQDAALARVADRVATAGSSARGRACRGRCRPRPRSARSAAQALALGQGRELGHQPAQQRRRAARSRSPASPRRHRAWRCRAAR